MKKHMSLLLAITMSLLVLATGCAGASESSSDAEGTKDSSSLASGKQLTEAQIGPKRAILLVKKLSSSFWTDLEGAARQQCEEYGWTMETLCPVVADSNEEQIKLLKQSLLNPPDVYLICAADSEGIAPAIEEINEAGVPIINVQTRIIGDDLDVVTFVGVDTYSMAQIGANAILDKRKDAKNAIILEGITGSNTTADIKKGVTEAFNERGINILASQTANGQRQDGMTVTQNLLQAYPDVDIIFAGNGEMALGAAEAIRQAGRDGISIATINTSKEITQAIMDGIITLTVDDVSWKLGEMGVEQAMNYFRGIPIDKEIMAEVQIESADNLDYYKEKYGL